MIQDPEDLILWPDGTWCYAYELEQYTHMSDDFRRIPVGSEEYEEHQQ